MEIFIEQPVPWSRSIRIHLRDGERIGKPIVFTKPENEAVQQEPAISLQCEHAQAFMDALWQAGFKPSEGTGSAGALKATQDHLKDMRKMAFYGIEDDK